jgi:hypothetical protein
MSRVAVSGRVDWLRSAVRERAASRRHRAAGLEGGTVAGSVCVLVLLVALIAASFALDLSGYLRARAARRPRHGRHRRRPPEDSG